MKTVFIAAATCSLGIRIAAQGTFENVNFQDANVSGYQAGSQIPTASAFPGWNTGSSESYYDVDGYEPYPYIAVLDSKSPGAIEGEYTVNLWAIQGSSVYVNQTGVVPSGTEWLQMDVNESGSSFDVRVNNQSLPMSPVQSFSGYTVYQGNISAWAGQSVNLEVLEYAPLRNGGELWLNNIAFSSVPEPGTLGLIATGAGCFWVYRRHQRTAKFA